MQDFYDVGDNAASWWNRLNVGNITGYAYDPPPYPPVPNPPPPARNNRKWLAIAGIGLVAYAIFSR